ncbi:hypothetical protein ABPG72_015345 [Tetrahymena utriculariae]
MQSQVLNILNKKPEKSVQVAEDNQNQIIEERLEEQLVDEGEDDHHHHHHHQNHMDSQNLKISQDLKVLQKGHQTRRVFIQGKNVSEFVLILKMRLQVKSVQVEGEHGCVSFKNPVKTDLILDLYGNSSLKLQLYLSRRSKGRTFKSFFSQKPQIQSSQQPISSSSSSQLSSSSSSSQTSQSLSQKSGQYQLASESSLLSSASIEYIKNLLQQQQQKQKEELINLFKQHYHEAVSNPWQQEQILYQKKLRAVFKRITELIEIEAIDSYIEFKNELLNEGFEYEDIMAVFGSRKPEIDNLIEIFRPYKELKTMTTCMDTMENVNSIKYKQSFNSINSKSNQLIEKAVLSQFTNDENNQAIIIGECDKSPNNKNTNSFKTFVGQQIKAEKGFIERYQQAREDRKSRSPFMSKEEQILSKSKSRSRSPTPICHQAGGDLFKY